MQRRELIRRVQLSSTDGGYIVSISQLWRWFEAPRRAFLYSATKSAQKIQDVLAAPIKALLK
jgi:hypothetical protein